MCLCMVKDVHRPSRQRSYEFKSKTYSWEGLCKSSQRRVDLVGVKCVIMGSFLVCVGHNVCGGKGRDIVFK